MEKQSQLIESGGYNSDVAGALRTSDNIWIAEELGLEELAAKTASILAEALEEFVDVPVKAVTSNYEFVEPKGGLWPSAEGKVTFVYLEPPDTPLLLLSGDEAEIQSLVLAILSNVGGPVANAAQSGISSAQLKLFQRLIHECTHIWNDHYKLFPEKNISALPINIADYESDEELQYGPSIEFTSKLLFAGTSLELKLLTSVGSFRKLSNGGKLDSRLAEAFEWKESLIGNLEQLPIELVAVATGQQCPLETISNLDAGQMVNLQFGQFPVAVKFEDGSLAFNAKVVSKDEQMFLQVHKNQKVNGSN